MLSLDIGKVSPTYWSFHLQMVCIPPKASNSDPTQGISMALANESNGSLPEPTQVNVAIRAPHRPMRTTSKACDIMMEVRH